MSVFQLITPFWRPFFEIAVFSFAYYVLFVYIKDSGMVQALKGLIILAIFYFVAQVLSLDAIGWVLSHLFQISILGFLIIFQPELRRGLTRIGQTPLFKMFLKEEKLINEVVQSVVSMSKNKIGALIAIEREVGLKPYIESGIPLDGLLSSELLVTIFMPNTPFHDGGVVIEGGRVAAVGCLFPLSQSAKLSRTLGTRHRAAVGLSEETDAVVIVVSEETGNISVSVFGKLTQNLDGESLRRVLRSLFVPEAPKGFAYQVLKFLRINLSKTEKAGP